MKLPPIIMNINDIYADDHSSRVNVDVPTVDSSNRKRRRTRSSDHESAINDNSTQGSFDGVPIDRVNDPKQQQYVDQLKDKFVRRAKNHRGNSHRESSLAATQSIECIDVDAGVDPLDIATSQQNESSKSYSSFGRARLGVARAMSSHSDDPLDVAASQQRTDGGSKSKQRRRGGEKRNYRSFGRANLERGGGSVITSDGYDDPLDIAVSQQRSNRGSCNDMVIPKLKTSKGGRKREVFIGQLQKPWGRGDTNRAKQREEQAAAALKRKSKNDDRSGNNSSGEERNRLSSKRKLCFVDDDDDDIMGVLEVASNERDKTKKVVELPPLGISRATQGREGSKYLFDEIEIESDSEVMSKRIPKKKDMKSKLKSQGIGRYEVSSNLFNFICVFSYNLTLLLFIDGAKGW